MLKAKKLITILLIETFFLSSLMPFSPQDLFADGSSRLAPPLVLDKDKNNGSSQLNVRDMGLGAGIVIEAIRGVIERKKAAKKIREISKKELIDAIERAVSEKVLEGFEFRVITLDSETHPDMFFIEFGNQDMKSILKLSLMVEDFGLKLASENEIEKIRAKLHTTVPIAAIASSNLRDLPEDLLALGLGDKEHLKPAAETIQEAMKREVSVRGGIIRQLGILRLSAPELFTTLRVGLKEMGVLHQNLFRRAVELISLLGNVFVRDATIKGAFGPLVRHLSALVSIQEEVSRIPAGRKLNELETMDLLSIAQKVSRVVYMFALKNPKFSELNLYESVCFVNDAGIRKLAIVLTPIAKRAFSEKWRVVILTRDGKGRYTKKEVRVSEIEMISDILERMELDSAYKSMLKFRVESLEYIEFGTPQSRTLAMEHFRTLAGDKEAPRVIIEEAENVINSKVSEVVPDFKDIIDRLTKGEMTVEELDSAFNRVLVSNPQILGYLQFTGDATGAWYELLDKFRTGAIVNQMYYLSAEGDEARAKSRLLIAQNAFEHAIVSAWIQVRRNDFASPLGERRADARIQDFIITMTSQSFGEPDKAVTGLEAIEYWLCNACAWYPCGLGQQGSLAIRLEVQANFIKNILRLMVVSPKGDTMETANEAQTAGSFLKGKITSDEKKEEIITRIRKRAVLDNVSGDQARREEPNLKLVDTWLAMNRKQLEQKRDSLLAESKAKWDEAKRLQETHCPLHLPIHQLFSLMAQGKSEEAVRLLMSESFGGAYLGLICPQEYLCQAGCTLGKVEERPIPIDIGKLEYLIVETYLTLNNGKLPKPRKEDIPLHNGKYAAVVGSGPAGLQEAYDLARAGYKVVVFEHLHKAGGVLGYGIPTFRLQEGLVDEHVRYLQEEMGVEFLLNIPVGEDGAFTIEELRQIFDVVFISTGAGKSNVMEYEGKSIPGRHLNGIYSAYHFLSWTYLMKAMAPGYKTPPPLSPKVIEAFQRAIDTSEPQEVTIVIEGIGNVAMDSARTALRWINVLNRRMGTKVKPKIVFVYRRPKEHLRMKARAEELRHTLEEGVGVIDIEVYELHQAVEYIDDDKGNISEIECIEYEHYQGPQKGRIRIKADMVIEALGAKPATETLGPSIPLNEWGYIDVDENMQVRGLDGSDGLAPVYASGDAAARRISDPEEAGGTAVLAAAQAKDAARHFIENYADMPKKEKRLEDKDPEVLFFKERPYKMYEILEVKEVGFREFPHIDKRQRIMEFVVYAPFVARRIRPGQFFTVMLDEFGEKIPITYLDEGPQPGTIRFAVQDIGFSTEQINNMKAGSRFFSINGPGGKPSIFAGLVGETITIGLGGATPTIVSIVRARAKLDKEIKDLIGDLGKLERGELAVKVEDFISNTNRILSQIRLPMPQIIKEISEALDKKEFGKALESLERFIKYAEGLGSEEQVLEKIRALSERANAIVSDEKLRQNEIELQAQLKYIVYPELDRIWEAMEKRQLERFRSSVIDNIKTEEYGKARGIIKGVVGAGIKTRVVVGAGNKDILLYLKELEGYVGKENIYISLEELELMLDTELRDIISGISKELVSKELGWKINLDTERVKINCRQYEVILRNLSDKPEELAKLKEAVKVAVIGAIGEEYYSDNPNETHFFFGYGTLPFGAIIERSREGNSYSGALVAGPPQAMHIFVDETDKINRPDVLNTWDVWLSINSTMFCIYGGCLYCLLLTDEKTIVRGCLGPEFPGKRIDRNTFVNRLRPASPHPILEKQEIPLNMEEIEAYLDNALLAVDAYSEATDRLVAVSAEEGIENAVLFADKDSGILYTAFSEDGNVRLIPIYGEGKEINIAKPGFIKDILPRLDGERLGIGPREKAGYALMIKDTLGLGDEAFGPLAVALGVSSVSGGSGLAEPSATQPDIASILKSDGKRLPINGIRQVPGTTLFEVSLSYQAYSDMLPLLKPYADSEKVELPAELTDYDFVILIDVKVNKVVSIILRNKTRVSEQFIWTLGETPESLLKYLVSQAGIAGQNPFTNYEVDEITPGAFLGPGVVSQAGSSVWNITGSWSEATLINHAFQICNQCNLCATICPEDAIVTAPSHGSSTGSIVLGVDTNFCKSCDACMNVCPLVNIALTRIPKKQMKFLKVSMDSLKEGRTVRLSGQNAAAIEALLRQGKFDELKYTIGIENPPTVETDTDNILQLSYARDRVRYLITSLKEENTIIIKPMRTLIVLGFEGKNRQLAEALRRNGFGAVVVLAQNQNAKNLKSLKEEALKAGFEVYALSASGKPETMGIARNVKDDSVLTLASEDKRLANPITADPDELTKPLGAANFAKLLSRIRDYNNTSLISASRPLPTRDEELDRILQAFRPSFDQQDRSSAPGGGLCPGCGQPLAVKIVSEATKAYATVVTVATGCLEVSSSGSPFITWLVNAVHGNYTAASAIALGIERAVRWFRKMRIMIFGGKPFVPVVFMGDGGLSIGLSVVSTVLRTGPTLVVVSNNFVTANTGGQPTQLSQVGATGPGFVGMVSKPGLSMPEFVKAHPDVYYARVSESDPEDFIRKVERAASWVASGRGSAVIESYGSACPTAWKADFTKTFEEEALAVNTAIGMVPFEMLNGHIRITRQPGVYDGNIYINSEYLDSTRYQLQGLVEGGLITTEELNAIMEVLTSKKANHFRRSLEQAGFGKPDSASTLMAKLSPDDVIESLVLDALNIPISSDGKPLLDDLSEFGVSPNDIETIMDFRQKNIFSSRTHFVSVVNAEAWDRIFKGVMKRKTKEDIETLIHTRSEPEAHKPAAEFRESKTAPFIAFETLEHLSIENGGPLSAETIGKIKPFLTLEHRRPHIVAILTRQRRFAQLLKDRRLVDRLQETVNKAIDELLAQAERDAVYFQEHADSYLFPSEPAQDIKEYKFKDVREAHEILVGTREALRYEDEAKNRRVREENKARKERLAKEPFEVRFHGRGGQGAVTASISLAKLCGEALGISAQGMPRFGGERLMAPVEAFLRVSGKRIKNRTSIKKPDIVCVLNESLLGLVPVTEGLGEAPLTLEEEWMKEEIISSFRPGGILLVNSPRTPVEIRKELEAQGVNTKDISIFTIDATDIANKFIGKNAPVNMIITSALIKLSQITRLDLNTEVSIDYLTKIISDDFNPEVAVKNRIAMEEAIKPGSIKTEDRPFEELRKGYLSSVSATAQPRKEERLRRKINTVIRVLDSNKAAALAAIQAGVNYCAGYAIFPSTGGTESMADYTQKGLPLEFDLLGSEDAVAAALLGAALAGRRVTTFTASVGLTYMFQHLPDMWGKRLPIVINVPVRAINIGTLNIFPDESDIVTVKDYGIFLRARNAQEAYDMNIIGWRIAEKMKMPVYVVYTGTLNSHTAEELEVFTDYDAIENYIGKRKLDEKGTILDQDNPHFYGAVTDPKVQHEIITQAEEDMQNLAPKVIQEAFREFEKVFGVSYSKLTVYMGEGNTYTEETLKEITKGRVDELIVASGANEETIETIVDELSSQGRRVAVLNITLRYPFPEEEVRNIVKKLKPKVVLVLDNVKSADMHHDVVGALYDIGTGRMPAPVARPVVYGLGGRELSQSDIRLLYDTLEAFKIIRELGARQKPLPVTKKWLKNIIESETATLEDIERYIDIQRRFDKLYDESDFLTEDEKRALANTYPKPQGGFESPDQEREWAGRVEDLIASAQRKQEIWHKILEASQSGAMIAMASVDDRTIRFMVRRLGKEISEEEIAFYNDFNTRVIEANIPGNRNIGTLLDLIHQAARATGASHLEREVIIQKLINGRILEIFGNKYMFGARRKFNQYDNLHSLVMELSIRISRELLKSKKGTPTQRLMAVECLLDLSKVTADFKIAETELNKLAKRTKNPPVSSRATELREINKERFIQL